MARLPAGRITELGLSALADACARSRTVRALDLSLVDVGPPQRLKSLANVWSITANITQLDIGGQHLTDEHLSVLGTQLRLHSGACLEHISIAGSVRWRPCRAQFS